MKLETVVLVLGMAVTAGSSCDKSHGELFYLQDVRQEALDNGWKFAEYLAHRADDPSCSYLDLLGHRGISVTIQGIDPQNEPAQAELCCLASLSNYGEDNYLLNGYCRFKE